jgi:hypothetical protein
MRATAMRSAACQRMRMRATAMRMRATAMRMRPESETESETESIPPYPPRGVWGGVRPMLLPPRLRPQGVAGLQRLVKQARN